MVAATRGFVQRMEGGRVEKRRPSRTPPWAKCTVYLSLLGTARVTAVTRRDIAGIWDERREEMRNVELEVSGVWDV